jgi:hypothetical protein
MMSQPVEVLREALRKPLIKSHRAVAGKGGAYKTALLAHPHAGSRNGCEATAGQDNFSDSLGKDHSLVA